MSQHLLILPILIPMLAALGLLAAGPGVSSRQRLVSLLACGLLLVVAVQLFHLASQGIITTYALGDWQAPFGIVLVLDRLSALMVLLTALLAVGSVIFASASDDGMGKHFHPLFQFQLVGINGAFLTGDLFNLFVFFEILLLSSYALLMHGGTRTRVASGLHYVVLNLVGSALFLISLGVLYGATGTLNMADMGLRIRASASDYQQLASVGGLLLIVVFSLKAALLPLYFWLPSAYAAAPASVAALFAIMTKVGVYAVIRVKSLIFADTPAQSGIDGWLWWAGLATLLLSSVGVLAARDLRILAAYLVVASAGTLMTAASLATAEGYSALLFYLINSTLMAGALFLVVELISVQRGQAGGRLVRARRLRQPAVLGALFAAVAIAIASLPPFAGALGKLMLMQAADGSSRLLFWSALLLASLCALVALSRAGSVVFWASHKGTPSRTRIKPPQLVGAVFLVISAPLTLLLAGPLSEYTHQAAAQMVAADAQTRRLPEPSGGL